MALTSAKSWPNYKGFVATYLAVFSLRVEAQNLLAQLLEGQLAPSRDELFIQVSFSFAKKRFLG